MRGGRNSKCFYLFGFFSILEKQTDETEWTFRTNKNTYFLPRSLTLSFYLSFFPSHALYFLLSFFPSPFIYGLVSHNGVNHPYGGNLCYLRSCLQDLFLQIWVIIKSFNSERERPRFPTSVGFVYQFCMFRRFWGQTFMRINRVWKKWSLAW